jgi:hypothetical protein
MTRFFRSALAVAAAHAAAACSAPEAPKTGGASPAASAVPVAPLAVHVALPQGASPKAMEWAKALEEAVAARQGDLKLVADASAAEVVVRVTSVEPAPEGAVGPGEGQAVVMHGALVVGDATREFNLAYRGAARGQAEVLARNLRRLGEETMQQSVAPPSPSAGTVPP